MQKDFILITLADDDEDDRMFFTEAKKINIKKAIKNTALIKPMELNNLD